jgi:hypothetical protein
MVQRLARSPFKAKIRVRFPLALPEFCVLILLFCGLAATRSRVGSRAAKNEWVVSARSAYLAV